MLTKQNGNVCSNGNLTTNNILTNANILNTNFSNSKFEEKIERDFSQKKINSHNVYI